MVALGFFEKEQRIIPVQKNVQSYKIFCVIKDKMIFKAQFSVEMPR